MSIEANIAALTAAVIELTNVMKGQQTVKPVTAAPAPAPVVPAPVVAPAMPAPPAFVAPAPVAALAAVPFSDGKTLIEYVMGAYKALGPTKGAGIQNVLVTLGYQNINDVKPEHYAALHAGVEALKA